MFNGFLEGVESSGGWPACKDLISSFISECFNMAEKVTIKRAHHTPKQEISTACACCFLTVGAGNEIAMSATRVLKGSLMSTKEKS